MRYVVEFPGVWLGGYAIVEAETEEDALINLWRYFDREHPTLYKKSQKETTQIRELKSGIDVLWDGDY